MFFKYHFKNIVLYDLILQDYYKNYYSLPYFNSIALNSTVKLRNLNEKNNYLILFYFILKILTNQKPFLIKLHKNNITFNLKKNNIIGCKLNLRKKQIYNLFVKFYCSNIKFNNISYDFQIKFPLNFYELKSELIDLFNVKPINVNFKIYNIKNNKIILFLKNFNILFN